MKLFEKTINSTSVFDGRILHITLDDVELEDGKKSKREVVNHPGGVTVAETDCPVSSGESWICISGF